MVLTRSGGLRLHNVTKNQRGFWCFGTGGEVVQRWWFFV
jgi:hypothetical protein